MPKEIRHLREQLLQAGRKRLLLQGYKGMTIRFVAADCRIAVGTVYNYFSSKEDLIASVMAEDWNSILDSARREADKAIDVGDVLPVLFNGIASFAATYRSIWKEYAQTVFASEEPCWDHAELIRQLTEIIETLCRRLDCLFCETLPLFLAESILCAALCPCASYEKLAPIYARLTDRCERLL